MQKIYLENNPTGRASGANDVALLEQLDAGSIVGTRTTLAVVRRSFQSVAVKPAGASFAVGAFGVMLADAAAGVDVAGGGVAVAVARNATG